MKNTFKEYLNEEVIKYNASLPLSEALIDTSKLPTVASTLDFKTMNRKGIIAVIALMLDALNSQYALQHNGDTLFGNRSIYNKLITK